MTEPCDRSYAHPSHTFVDGHGTDHQCPGGQPARTLAEILADRPQVAGIGVATEIHALEVMSA